MSQILQDEAAELRRQLAEAKAENAKLKAKAQAAAMSKLSIKVKPLGVDEGKGNVSVYGLGRYPVTLYPGQWQRLLSLRDDILAEIEVYKDQLAWKDSD